MSLTWLVTTISVQSLQLKDEESKTQKDKVACPMSHNQKQFLKEPESQTKQIWLRNPGFFPTTPEHQKNWFKSERFDQIS